jgi:hypothetical protein
MENMNKSRSDNNWQFGNPDLGRRNSQPLLFGPLERDCVDCAHVGAGRVPHAAVGSVVLRGPGIGLVDGLSVDGQPAPHVPETLLRQKPKKVSAVTFI